MLGTIQNMTTHVRNGKGDDGMKTTKCDFCGKIIEKNKYQIRKRYVDMTLNWSWEYYDICESCIETLKWMRKENEKKLQEDKNDI